MSEQAAKRLRLFDLYVHQTGHEGMTQGKYFFCPLCRQPFERHDTAGDNPRLTLAHIIPYSLDGTLTTLTCAACNNGKGSNIDRELLTCHQHADWTRGHGAVKVRLGDGRKVAAELRRNTEMNRLEINIMTPMVNPSVSAFQEMLSTLLQNPGQGKGFRVRVPRVRANWCRAAVCHSVYLLMFKYFGYDFARNPRYDFFLNQIHHPDERHDGIHTLELPREVADLFLNGEQASVVFVQEPMRAVVAVLRFRSPGGVEQVLAVGMPGPDEPAIAELNLENAIYTRVPEDTEALRSELGSFWSAWQHWLSL